LGYKTRLGMGFLLAYLAGLFLQLIVGYWSYFAGYMFGYFGWPKLKITTLEPWKNIWWRRIARKLLTDELAPSTNKVYYPDVHERALKLAEDYITEPVALGVRKQEIANEYLQLQISDSDWYWLYQVLKDYYVEPEILNPPAAYYFGMLHSSGWATLLLIVIDHQYRFWFILASISTIVSGSLATGLRGYGSDPHGISLAAHILKTLNAADAKVSHLKDKSESGGKSNAAGAS
jgi:hypothetical protein